MDKLQLFGQLFQVPDFVLSYLKFFVSGQEIDYVLVLGTARWSFGEAATRLGLEDKAARTLLEDLYQKHIVNRQEVDGQPVYAISDFYAKLDYQCKFGSNYHDIPKQVRDALDAWCYEEYRTRTLPYIKQLEANEEVTRVPETYELLENIDEFIDRSHKIQVVPCNCRMLAQNCDRPTGTCIGFDDSLTDRTGGKPLTKNEAKELVRLAHKKGLMHQVNSDWRTNGPAWMCNCCACCCYPLRLSQELGSKGAFPVIQYAANRDEEACTHCGACTKRCHFGAFHFDGMPVVLNGKPGKHVAFDPAKCFGCGICTTTCPSKAISMSRIG